MFSWKLGDFFLKRTRDNSSFYFFLCVFVCVQNEYELQVDEDRLEKAREIVDKYLIPQVSETYLRKRADLRYQLIKHSVKCTCARTLLLLD